MSSDNIEKLEPQRPTTEKEKTSLSGEESFIERRDTGKPGTDNINVKLANPLAGISHEQLLADAEDFAKTHGLSEHVETIQKGALLAQDPAAFETLPMLTEHDRVVLRREFTHKWDQPKTLYYMVIMCSVAAAVQGVSLLVHSFVRCNVLTSLDADGRIGDQRCKSLLPESIWHRSRS